VPDDVNLAGKDDRMQIGFNLPVSGALTSADAFTRLAVEGEAIGFWARRLSTNAAR
jgi:hypothetical protein